VGTTLIVAKDEIVINTNKATVSSFKKKQTTVAIKKTQLLCKKGDSLYSISQISGVTIADLKMERYSRRRYQARNEVKING
jgi:membrane-bound lytic murein transglycosylase D